MPSQSVSQLFEFLHIVPNPDGTLTRLPEFYPTVPPSGVNSDDPSLSKDAVINQENGTWARLYLPRQALSSPTQEKLPIVVFVHGGGFVVVSAAHHRHQEFCTEAASRLGALVVSLEYRFAPEHRLPAAYDDVLEGLLWIRDSRDEWLRLYGDLSRCVVMGESAGGNIVYFAGLRAANKILDLKPLIINGLVLIQPYFSGLERTGSELRSLNDPVLPLDVNDLMWSLALPKGADRSHEYCNPTAGGGSGLLGQLADSEWRVVVMASDMDPLFDRAVELGELMEKRGVRVKWVLDKGGKHGEFINDVRRRNDLYNFLLEFLS